MIILKNILANESKNINTLNQYLKNILFKTENWNLVKIRYNSNTDLLPEITTQLSNMIMALGLTNHKCFQEKSFPYINISINKEISNSNKTMYEIHNAFNIQTMIDKILLDNEYKNIYLISRVIFDMSNLINLFIERKHIVIQLKELAKDALKQTAPQEYSDMYTTIAENDRPRNISYLLRCVPEVNRILSKLLGTLFLQTKNIMHTNNFTRDYMNLLKLGLNEIINIFYQMYCNRVLQQPIAKISMLLLMSSEIDSLHESLRPYNQYIKQKYSFNIHSFDKLSNTEELQSLFDLLDTINNDVTSENDRLLIQMERLCDILESFKFLSSTTEYIQNNVSPQVMKNVSFVSFETDNIYKNINSSIDEFYTEILCNISKKLCLEWQIKILDSLPTKDQLEKRNILYDKLKEVQTKIQNKVFRCNSVFLLENIQHKQYEEEKNKIKDTMFTYSFNFLYKIQDNNPSKNLVNHTNTQLHQNSLHTGYNKVVINTLPNNYNLSTTKEIQEFKPIANEIEDLLKNISPVNPQYKYLDIMHTTVYHNLLSLLGIPPISTDKEYNITKNQIANRRVIPSYNTYVLLFIHLQEISNIHLRMYILLLAFSEKENVINTSVLKLSVANVERLLLFKNSKLSKAHNISNILIEYVDILFKYLTEFIDIANDHNEFRSSKMSLKKNKEVNLIYVFNIMYDIIIFAIRSNIVELTFFNQAALYKLIPDMKYEQYLHIFNNSTILPTKLSSSHGIFQLYHKRILIILAEISRCINLHSVNELHITNNKTMCMCIVTSIANIYYSNDNPYLGINKDQTQENNNTQSDKDQTQENNNKKSDKSDKYIIPNNNNGMCTLISPIEGFRLLGYEIENDNISDRILLYLRQNIKSIDIDKLYQNINTWIHQYNNFKNNVNINQQIVNVSSVIKGYYKQIIESPYSFNENSFNFTQQTNKLLLEDVMYKLISNIPLYCSRGTEEYRSGHMYKTQMTLREFMLSKINQQNKEILSYLKFNAECNNLLLMNYISDYSIPLSKFALRDGVLLFRPVTFQQMRLCLSISKNEQKSSTNLSAMHFMGNLINHIEKAVDDFRPRYMKSIGAKQLHMLFNIQKRLHTTANDEITDEANSKTDNHVLDQAKSINDNITFMTEEK